MSRFWGPGILIKLVEVKQMNGGLCCSQVIEDPRRRKRS